MYVVFRAYQLKNDYLFHGFKIVVIPLLGYRDLVDAPLIVMNIIRVLVYYPQATFLLLFWNRILALYREIMLLPP